MKKTIFLFSMGIMLLTSACAFNDGTPMTSTSSTSATGVSSDGKTLPPVFNQFSDIPIPERSEMDLKRSLIFGNQQWWTGRLVFASPYSSGGLFDFFMSEMPKFGWQEITVVRSKNSVLTFRQGNRVATILISGDNSGAEVEFTVSPSSISQN